ncbi:G protein-activated inward rectifier potassium channel 3-like [Ptychodera flava]|uniref:G protein-activated inward rectifier potassium channel 3-like n=1 Tax=Ptychodera flava TaxID=63121 RepID=UPI003969E8E7
MLRSSNQIGKSTEYLIHSMDQTTGKKKMRKRLVEKGGRCTIIHNYQRTHNFRFLSDIFTTLVDIKWRYNLTVFTLAYLISWVIFSILWWLIALEHGDLDTENLNDINWEPCVTNVHSFATAFLFSLETQTTIGYGFRSITDECWVGILIVVIQSVVSCMIDAVMIGCVFAKIAKPKRRAETLVFSKNAVIAKRDGKLCLMIQLADMRHSHLFEAHIRAKLIKHRETEEGEIIPLYQYDLNMGYDQGLDRIFLVWPLVLEHVIDKNSPLYEMSATDLKKADFEIIVILEGIVASTGMTTQKLTSYLPDEIKWGFRFNSQIIGTHGDCFAAFYSLLNDTIPTPTPSLSMKELDEKRETEANRTEADTTTSTLNEDRRNNSNTHGNGRLAHQTSHTETAPQENHTPKRNGSSTIIRDVIDIEGVELKDLTTETETQKENEEKKKA